MREIDLVRQLQEVDNQLNATRGELRWIKKQMGHRARLESIDRKSADALLKNAGPFVICGGKLRKDETGSLRLSAACTEIESSKSRSETPRS